MADADDVTDDLKCEVIAPLSTASILHRLPPPIFALTLQFLTFTERLTQVTQICRSFPPLEPAAFICDAVLLSQRLYEAWSSSLRLQHRNCPPYGL